MELISLWDLAIVLGYLAASLFVGIYVGRNITNVSDYTLGGRKFSTGVLFCTILATFVGGESIMGRAEKVFSVGIIYIFASLGYFVSHFTLGYFIAPKMFRFEGKISAGEIMEVDYGVSGRIITGFLGFVYSCGKMALQISAIGYTFEALAGISYFWGVILGFGIVVCYSAFGGVRAVTFTDVFQFFVILISVPTAAFVALRHTGSWGQIFSDIYRDHPSHLNPFLNPDLLKKYIPMFFVFCIPSLHPATVQRLLMAKNGDQGKKAFIFTALCEIPLYFLVMLIGFATLKLNPNISPNHCFPYLIHSVFPIGIKGLAIAGILAAIMSTADSILNSGCVTLIHDCVNPMLGRRLKGHQELRLVRWFTAVMGIVSVYISMQFPTLVDLMVGVKEYWMPLIIPPLLGTLLGFRTTKGRFWASLVVGISVLWIWKYTISAWYNWDALVPATIANALVFFSKQKKFVTPKE